MGVLEDCVGRADHSPLALDLKWTDEAIFFYGLIIQMRVSRDFAPALPNPDIAPTSMPSALLEDSSIACQQVWAGEIQKGDYSPLLLRPNERRALSNPLPPEPSWLVGVNSLNDAKWDLERQMHPANRVPSSLCNRTIQIELDVVGMIESIHYTCDSSISEERTKILDLKGPGTCSGVVEVAQPGLARSIVSPSYPGCAFPSLYALFLSR